MLWETHMLCSPLDLKYICFRYLSIYNMHTCVIYIVLYSLYIIHTCIIHVLILFYIIYIVFTEIKGKRLNYCTVDKKEN